MTDQLITYLSLPLLRNELWPTVLMRPMVFKNHNSGQYTVVCTRETLSVRVAKVQAECYKQSRVLSQLELSRTQQFHPLNFRALQNIMHVPKHTKTRILQKSGSFPNNPKLINSFRRSKGSIYSTGVTLTTTKDFCKILRTLPSTPYTSHWVLHQKL